MKSLTYSLGMLSLIGSLGLAQPPTAKDAGTTAPSAAAKKSCGCTKCTNCNGCEKGCKCDTGECTCKSCECTGGCHTDKHKH